MRGRVLRRLVIIAVLGAFGLAPNTVFAQAQKPQVPDAAASNPSVLAWMVGSPPPENRIIRFSDGSFYKFPQLRWSFSNMRQLVPTANVARGSGCVVPLPRAERPDLDAIAFTTMDGRKMTWMQSLPVLCADGIVVLHRGAIVYERYCGVLEPLKPHSAFSVTKSFVGTLATMLAAEGVIDPAAPVTRYLPEMKNTAYGDATVRQVMDMTIGVKFSEDYSDPNAEAFAYARAGGMMPRSPGLSGPTEPLRVPGHGAEAGEPRRGLRISDRQYRGAGVDPHAHRGPDAGATHVGADLVEAWGGARCLLHRGRHRHRMGRRRPRTDRGSRQR